MPYSTVLFDLDHTLLDSHESERLAYAHTMGTITLDDPDAHFERYVTINQSMWRAVEAGELQPADVRHLRFERFAAELALDADPHAMADAFVHGLGAHGDLYDGAREVLDTLAEHAVLALVTNGLGDVQRARIERLGLERYFRVVTISGEVGVTKPRPEIFDLTFDALGDPDRAGSLMVGDSLTSDIRGGRDFGIDTCWYNPGGVERADSDRVTYEIRHLAELVRIVVGD